MSSIKKGLKMKQDKAIEFFANEVLTRFPNWNPGPALKADWIDYLKNFNYDVAQQAIKQHAFSSRFTYPVLKEFYAIAMKLQHQKNPTKKNQDCDRRWCKYQVKCLSGKRRGFTKTAAIKTEFAGNDKAERIEAENLKNFFQRRYGGKWIVESLKERPNHQTHSEKTPDYLIPAMSGIGEDDVPF
jgi:hypothetical protein